MKKVLKIFGGIIIAAALTVAGYMAGTHNGMDSISSALPHVNINHGENVPPPPSPSAETENTEKPAEPPSNTEKNIIEKNSETAVQSGWTMVDKAPVSLDGNTYTMYMYTSAQKDSDGSYLWDDGNKWVIEVEKDGEYYTLLNKYVQCGTVNYVTGEDEKGECVITAVTGTNTCLTIEKYTYNGTAFEGQTVYNSGILNIKGSTLSYIN